MAENPFDRTNPTMRDCWDAGHAAGVAAERAAFTPPPSDEEKEDGWQISTPWLEAVCEAMHTPDGERCSWEQIECVLLRAAAIRAGEDGRPVVTRAATKLEPVRIVHISVGGPLLYMPLSSKRGITFEDHRIFGPVPCYPNGEPRKNGVRPQSPFWDLYEAWCKAGKPVVNGTNQCDMRHATPEQPR